MPSRSRNVVIAVEAKVTLENATIFDATSWSKWFFEKFIVAAPLPASTRAINFEDCEVEDRFFHALNSIASYFNRVCKFHVLGWVKRGEVQDQGVDQPSNGLPHNVSRVVV